MGTTLNQLIDNELKTLKYEYPYFEDQQPKTTKERSQQISNARQMIQQLSIKLQHNNRKITLDKKATAIKEMAEEIFYTAHDQKEKRTAIIMLAILKLNEQTIYRNHKGESPWTKQQ